MRNPITVIDRIQAQRDVEAGRELVIAVNDKGANVACGIGKLRVRPGWDTKENRQKQNRKTPTSNIQYLEKVQFQNSKDARGGMLWSLGVGIILEPERYFSDLLLPHSKTGVMKRYGMDGHGIPHVVGFIAKRPWAGRGQALLHTFVVPAEAGLVPTRKQPCRTTGLGSY